MDETSKVKQRITTCLYSLYCHVVINFNLFSLKTLNMATILDHSSKTGYMTVSSVVR